MHKELTDPGIIAWGLELYRASMAGGNSEGNQRAASAHWYFEMAVCGKGMGDESEYRKRAVERAGEEKGKRKAALPGQQKVRGMPAFTYGLQKAT